MSDEPWAYRAPLRSRSGEGVPSVEHARERGVVGIGGVLAGRPKKLDEALTEMDRTHGLRAAWRLERFARAPDDSFVWTQDDSDLTWLGRLAGPWFYDSGGESCDLVHVRPCRWLSRPVDPAVAPAGVSAAFARGGRNWQRIHAPGTGARSAELWRIRAE